MNKWSDFFNNHIKNNGKSMKTTFKIFEKDKRVKKIRADTFAEKNASVRVLEKCNFKFIEEYYDEEGLTWKWIKEK